MQRETRYALRYKEAMELVFKGIGDNTNHEIEIIGGRLVSKFTNHTEKMECFYDRDHNLVNNWIQKKKDCWIEENIEYRYNVK